MTESYSPKSLKENPNSSEELTDLHILISFSPIDYQQIMSHKTAPETNRIGQNLQHDATPAKSFLSITERAVARANGISYPDALIAKEETDLTSQQPSANKLGRLANAYQYEGSGTNTGNSQRRRLGSIYTTKQTF